MELITSPEEWQTIHTTLQHLNLIGVTFSPDFMIQNISAHALMKTGWSEQELVGHSLFDKLVPIEEA